MPTTQIALSAIKLRSASGDRQKKLTIAIFL
jgi:hypothetical protein